MGGHRPLDAGPGCPQAQQLRAAKVRGQPSKGSGYHGGIHTDLSFLLAMRSRVPEGPRAGDALRPVARRPRAAWRCDKGFGLPLGKLPALRRC